MVMEMIAPNYNVLKELTQTPSVSGYEDLLRKKIIEIIRPYVDKIKTDALGNIIAIKRGTCGKKLMLEAHYDQIGFIVKHIEKNGMIRVQTIGGVDPQIAVGERVLIWSKTGPIPGIISGLPPIHLKKENNGTLSIDALYIDVGLDTYEDVSKRIKIGDIVTFDLVYEEMLGEKICATGLDNKISAFILIELAKRFQNVTPCWDLYFVFAVQEEVGLRGARTATYKVNPDGAIILDVTHAQYPPIPPNKAPIIMNNGPAIMVSPAVHQRLYRFIVEVAEKYSIKIQYETAGRFTGTDTDVVQLTRAGIPVGLISIPLKYMHTPREVVSKKDVDTTIILLEKIIESLDATTMFLY